MTTLYQEVAVTAELTGTSMSEAAAEVMTAELSAYSRDQVLVALRRCRSELKTRLTLAAIIERLDDGRPGPQEAWAMIPKTEAQSVVWSGEMAEAFGVCSGLLEDGDKIAARVAFIEAYQAACARSREARAPVVWSPSLGTDPAQRAAAIEHAERLNRLTHDHAQALLPAPAAVAPQVAAMIGRAVTL